ncbi:unnamed protein product [Mycena citricolor]|uniref:Uncharacterized protein n=1 Tax=Mycena citricolor TaxID=2018698 RepID=A0AAD2Q2W6_9AGAR|nr:unnamed protein product [Mycena citricolor]
MRLRSFYRHNEDAADPKIDENEARVQLRVLALEHLRRLIATVQHVTRGIESRIAEEPPRHNSATASARDCHETSG